MLYQLIYCSKTNQFDESVLTDIFKQSVYRNYKNNIKGFLFVVNKKSYIQILQGPFEKINHLYNKISKDDRHHDVNLLSFKKIECYNLNYWNIRSIIDSSNNLYLNKCWSMILDSDGYVIPTLVSEKIIFDSIFYKQIEFDKFDNCIYDFKLVSDLFNVIDDSTSLELTQNLNIYHTAYDAFKKSNSKENFKLLSEAETKLKNLVYKKHEKSRP
jgi:hypothetical protein